LPLLQGGPVATLGARPDIPLGPRRGLTLPWPSLTGRQTLRAGLAASAIGLCPQGTLLPRTGLDGPGSRGRIGILAWLSRGILPGSQAWPSDLWRVLLRVLVGFLGLLLDLQWLLRPRSIRPAGAAPLSRLRQCHPRNEAHAQKG